MNHAATDVHSAVDAAATVLEELFFTIDENRSGPDATRKLTMATVEICAVALRHIVDGSANDVSNYAGRLSDAAGHPAEEKEVSHADQP